MYIHLLMTHYLSFKPDKNADQVTAISALQDCVAAVRRWMLSDKLMINDKKTEFLMTGTKQQLAKLISIILLLATLTLSVLTKLEILVFGSIVT